MWRRGRSREQHPPLGRGSVWIELSPEQRKFFGYSRGESSQLLIIRLFQPTTSSGVVHSDGHPTSGALLKQPDNQERPSPVSAAAAEPAAGRVKPRHRCFNVTCISATVRSGSAPIHTVTCRCASTTARGLRHPRLVWHPFDLPTALPLRGNLVRATHTHHENGPPTAPRNSSEILPSGCAGAE